MFDKNGNKISLAEYTARAMVNVVEKAAAPVITFAVGYTVYFHGEDIANGIKKKINERNRRKDNK